MLACVGRADFDCVAERTKSGEFAEDDAAVTWEAV
jgi:hypothetical protein